MRYPPSIRIDGTNLPSRRQEKAEEIAMRLLPGLLGGEADRKDVPGGPPGMYDFDLVGPGQSIAIEVRATVDRVVAEFEAALNDHALHWNLPGLSRSWEVRIHETVTVKQLIADVGPKLAAAERLGMSGLAADPLDSEHMVRDESSRREGIAHDAVNRLIALGVDTAWAFDREDGQTSVEFIKRSTHASGRTEHLVTAEVNKAVVQKSEVLSRPPARQRDARQLFTWLDSDFGGPAVFGLWSGYPELAPPPSLPEHIDHCWVGMWSLTPDEGIGHVVIWEAERGGSWRYPSALTTPVTKLP